MPAAKRVAYRYLYARLIKAMSMGEALVTLGFPPNASPSKEEITKAYRQKAFQNHPDRGGDSRKMVEVNVAKDILEGKGKPSRFSPEPRTSPSYTRYEPPPAPPPVKGKSFEQALSGIPSGVDWKFVSGSAYAQGQVETPVGKFWRSYNGWVVYGQTEAHHVFVGIRSESNQNHRPGDKDSNVAWEAIHLTVPRSINLIRLAPKIVVNIIRNLSGMSGVTKYALPKKFRVLDGTFHEKDLSIRAGLSLKDAIIGSGAMPAESTGLKGRNMVVTVEPIQTKDSYKAYKDYIAAGGSKQDTYRAYNWLVEVNGKGRSLDMAEVAALDKNYFLSAVFSYDYSKGRKNISNLRGGRMSAGAAEALKLLHKALHGGPLKEQVGEAAIQMAAQKK